MPSWIKHPLRSVSRIPLFFYSIVAWMLQPISNIALSKDIHLNIIRIVLIVIAAVSQVGFAIAAYLIFYNRFLPNQITTIPLYLQYGYGDNPFALATITTQNLKTDQVYDVSLSLIVPPSPVNQAKGNFMVALHLLDAADGGVDLVVSPRYPQKPNKDTLLEGADVLETYRRSLIVPYVDPITVLASRLLFLPLNIFRRTAPKSGLVLTTTMASSAPFGKSGRMPTFFLLEFEAGQSLQVYSSSITLTAQLSGPRWIMCHYWMSSFLVLTSMFWMIEFFLTIVVWLILNRLIGSHYKRPKPSHHISDHRPSLPPKDSNDKAAKLLDKPVVIKKEEEDVQGENVSIASMHTVGGSDGPDGPNVRGGARASGRDSASSGQLKQRRSQESIVSST